MRRKFRFEKLVSHQRQSVAKHRLLRRGPRRLAGRDTPRVSRTAGREPSRTVGRPASDYRPYEIALPASLRGVKAQRPVKSGLVRRTRTQKLSFPTRWMSGVLLVLCAWSVYWFANASTFYIHQVQVEGTSRLSEAEVLNLSALQGVNVFWADTAQATRLIEALPDVESARVRCQLPGRCVINIVERHPALIWRQGEAHIWVGEDGVAVPARGKLPDAIVLESVGTTALKPGDRLDPEIIQAIHAMQALRPQVRVLEYSERYGLMFSIGPDQKVRLGDGSRIATKLAILEALNERLLDQGIRPSLIDVRYPEAPYFILVPAESGQDNRGLSPLG